MADTKQGPEKNLTLDEKLVKIQSELKAPKSNYNAFGKFHYRNAEDILESVKPILHKYGVTMTISDKVIVLGEGSPTVQTVTEILKTKDGKIGYQTIEKPIGGARYYIEATVTLKDSGESITTQAYAREEETKRGMDGSMISGASSSYARKYALNGMFLIDDTKDADNQDNRQQSATEIKEPEQKITIKTPAIEIVKELPKPKADQVLYAQIWAKIMSSKDIDELAVQAKRIKENEHLLDDEMIEKLTKAGTKKKKELNTTNKVT